MIPQQLQEAVSSFLVDLMNVAAFHLERRGGQERRGEERNEMLVKLKMCCRG
jgi:hypothetical protein